MTRGKYIRTEEHKKRLREFNIGRHLSEETKRKISKIKQERKQRLGYVNSPEARKRISEAKKGIHFSDEHRRKMGEVRKGKHRSEEIKKRMSEAHKGQVPWIKGKTHSEEAKRKISDALRKRCITNETRRKLSESNKGKVISEEARKRISEFNKGKHHSYESRKKMSAAKQNIPIEKWSKFTGYEPYTNEFNPRFKSLIRKRDNQICMNCGIHREKLDRALDIHHINYDKKLSIPENCLSLCRQCHLITQINREYWTKLFQDKLSKLYSYKYSDKGVIELDLKEVK